MTEIMEFISQYTFHLRSGQSITLNVPCEVDLEQDRDGTFTKVAIRPSPEQMGLDPADDPDLPVGSETLLAIDPGTIAAVGVKAVRNQWYQRPPHRSAGHEIAGSRRTRAES